MPTGRRGFFKQLGGLLAGMTVAGRIKLEQERKLAPPYVRKYLQNSVPVNKTLNSPYGSGFLCCSGSYAPSMYASGILLPCSGRFISNNMPVFPPNSLEEI